MVGVLVAVVVVVADVVVVVVVMMVVVVAMVEVVVAAATVAVVSLISLLYDRNSLKQLRLQPLFNPTLLLLILLHAEPLWTAPGVKSGINECELISNYQKKNASGE